MESTKKGFYGPWIIAACFVTFGLSTGFPYYNIAFFFDYFRDDHSWTIELVTMGAPIAVLLTIWAGPVIVPRTSPRKLILIGTGLTFVAFQWFAVLGGSKLEYFAAWCLCPASAGTGEKRSAVKLTERTHEKATKAQHSRREGRRSEAAFD